MTQDKVVKFIIGSVAAMTIAGVIGIVLADIFGKSC